MKTIYPHVWRLLAVVLIFGSAHFTFSQSSGGSYTVTSHVASGGGCAPDGLGGCTQSIGSGNLVLNGTVGEPGASNQLSETPFTTRFGFWHTIVSLAPTAADGNITGRI